MSLPERLAEIGVVPVVALPDVECALPLAEALLEGGLACAEITFRTAAAAAALPLVRQRFPELLLGAGTVLTTEQADMAIDAGAQFVVSPGPTSPWWTTSSPAGCRCCPAWPRRRRSRWPSGAA